MQFFAFCKTPVTVTPPSTLFLSLKDGFPVLERVKPHLHIWYISVYRSVFHLPMHTNEDLGKAFPDANGELSGLTVLAGCKARAEKEEISLSPWESIAYWCKEPSNLSTLFKQFTQKEKKPQTPTNRGKKERKGFLLQIDRNGCIEFLLIKSLHSKELQGTKEALWLFRGREWGCKDEAWIYKQTSPNLSEYLGIYNLCFCISNTSTCFFFFPSYFDGVFSGRDSAIYEGPQERSYSTVRDDSNSLLCFKCELKFWVTVPAVC